MAYGSGGGKNRFAMRDVSAEDLYRMYHEEKLSQKDIAKQLGVTQGAVFYWMKRHEVSSRDMTEARRAASDAGRNSGSRNGRWGGGRHIANGYWRVLLPSHPKADRHGYVREHVLIWEESNGASLPLGWHVHHKNGDKTDNRPENLEAMSHQKHRDLIPSLLRRIGELENEVRRLSDDLTRTDSPVGSS